MKRASGLLCGLLAFAVACSAGGVSGSMSTWVKGKSFSLQAIDSKGLSPGPMWTLTLRNDTEHELQVAPVKVTAWFKQAGQKEATVNPGQMSGTGLLKPRQEVMLA